MSSSCGWGDQESQRRQNSLPKEEASRGDLELEEWLNTPAKYALGHENYSEHLKNRGCKEGALTSPSFSLKAGAGRPRLPPSPHSTKKRSGDQKKGVGGWHIVQTDLVEVTSIFRCTAEWFSYTSAYTHSFSDSFLIQVFTEY